MPRFSGISLAVLFFALGSAIGLQWWSGAYSSDFDSHSDESAHVVSSLLIVDYLQHGFPENPLEFAGRYYVHYPKVAIGHWPPLFHSLEAGWMLIAGRKKFSLISLLAIFAAVLVAALFAWIKNDQAWSIAAVAVILLATPRFMQMSVTCVMPDLLLGILALGAAAAWAAYLENRHKRDAILYCGFTLAAVATNPRGLALALIPLVCAWLVPKNRRRLIAITIPVLLVLCLPELNRFRGRGFAIHIASNAANYIAIMGSAMGWPVVLLAVLGTYCAIRSVLPVRWRAMVGLAGGAVVFHSFSGPELEHRYLVTAAPAVAALAAAGAAALWNLNRPRAVLTVLRFVLIAALLFTIGRNVFQFSRKRDLGYHAFVDGRSPLIRQNRILIISGDPRHEGSLIAEIALRDHGMEHIVLRGTKMLSSSTWAGRDYQMKFTSPDQVRTYLESVGATLVIAQTTEQAPDTAQLLAAMEGGSEHWKEVAKGAYPEDVRLFQYDGPPPARRMTIRIPFQVPFHSPIEFHE
jgi:hypothetical protein